MELIRHRDRERKKALGPLAHAQPDILTRVARSDRAG
jgi:hypothetical protein